MASLNPQIIKYSSGKAAEDLLRAEFDLRMLGITYRLLLCFMTIEVGQLDFDIVCRRSSLILVLIHDRNDKPTTKMRNLQKEFDILVSFELYDSARQTMLVHWFQNLWNVKYR